MALSSAKRKRHSRGDVLDKDEKTSLELKRRQHAMVLRSQECAWTEDIPMNRTRTLDSSSRTLPNIQKEAHHILPPGMPSLQIIEIQSTSENLATKFEGFERTEPSGNKILDSTKRSTSAAVLSSSRELRSQSSRTDRGFEKTPKIIKVMEKMDVPQQIFSVREYGLGKKRRLQLENELLDIRKHLNETSVLLENLIKTACTERTTPRDINYVDASAANFEVYSFLQKRANDILQNEMVAFHDIELCPDTVSIATKRTDSTFLYQFKSQDTSETFQSKIAVFIGEDDDLFDVFFREALPETTICRIQPNGQTGSDEKEIIREDWGFNCYGNYLTNETTITECIDTLLERVVLEKLASAAEAIPTQRKSTGGIITEVKELFTLTKVPMPNWLKEWELDSETLAARKRLTKISEKLLSLPYVFGCHVTDACINIMIRRGNESKRIDLITDLKDFGLSNEEFTIRVAEIKPFADNKFRSGDSLAVRGSKNVGTLGCFAKFKQKEVDHHKTVVVTARHVVNANDTDNKELVVNDETLGKVLEKAEEADDVYLDIAIGEVTAPHSKCETAFRRENGDKGLADLYEPIPSELVNKRVHLWGARTSPGAAKLSNFKLSASNAGEYMFIAMPNDKNVLAKEGDSGAMVLMERYPKDSPNMYAIGTLVGEVYQYPIDDQPTETGKEKMPESEQPSSSLLEGPEAKAGPLQAIANEKLYAVVPIKRGFDHLSRKHRGSLTLFTSSDQQ